MKFEIDDKTGMIITRDSLAQGAKFNLTKDDKYYIKLHAEIISKLLEYSNLMLKGGVESESYTLTNKAKITIHNGKRSFKMLLNDR